MANTYAVEADVYISATESFAVADSAGANVVTVNGSALHNRMLIDGVIIAFTATVTETCAGDGAIDFRLEGSADGSSWAIVDSTASVDLDPTGSNTVAGVLSAVNYKLPYYRVVLFTDGTDILDACAVTVITAARNDDSQGELRYNVL